MPYSRFIKEWRLRMKYENPLDDKRIYLNHKFQHLESPALAEGLYKFNCIMWGRPGDSEHYFSVTQFPRVSEIWKRGENHLKHFWSIADTCS